MQTYNWETRILISKKFSVDKIFKIACSTYAMRVSVKAFSIRYKVHWYDFKATEFSKQERKSMIDQSKVKPYFTRA